jgi:DNA-binding YbaB/EbfC family protein
MMGWMKKAQEMQARMQEMQAEMEQTVVEGQSGGGLVKVILNAKGQMKSVSIDPTLLKPDDREIVEDLLVTAHEEARKKVERVMEEKMKAVAAGLPIPPGLKLPF